MKTSKKSVTLIGAISIGIGGMVGGGIFAVLGLAVSLGKGATPLSFLVAGFIALLTCYSYVKLSKSYPDRGGTVKFINKGFGRGLFSGAVNNLLWLSYVIMLGLYASSFGSYAPNLFPLSGDSKIDFHIYSSLIVLIATFINYYSISAVSKIESVVVIIKLTILIAFVFIAGYGLMGNPNLSQLDISQWETPIHIITGGMVIFVAYEGFELIANSVPDLQNPQKNISKAYYYSVGFVVLLYLAIAIITVGSLPFSEIASAQDYALAEAAKPVLGQVGFTIITIAALLSTFSAINASLYGGSRVSFKLAQDDEAPNNLTGLFWNQPIGLAITAVLTLLVVNALKLESISTAGSVGFLLIFSMVNLACYKKAEEIGANKWIALSGTALAMIALIALILQQLSDNPTSIYISMGIILVCFIGEAIYKKRHPKGSS